LNGSVPDAASDPSRGSGSTAQALRQAHILANTWVQNIKFLGKDITKGELHSFPGSPTDLLRQINKENTAALGGQLFHWRTTKKYALLLCPHADAPRKKRIQRHSANISSIATTTNRRPPSGFAGKRKQKQKERKTRSKRVGCRFRINFLHKAASSVVWRVSTLYATHTGHPKYEAVTTNGVLSSDQREKLLGLAAYFKLPMAVFRQFAQCEAEGQVDQRLLDNMLRTSKIIKQQQLLMEALDAISQSNATEELIAAVSSRVSDHPSIQS